jgi:excisionase family DNA binding protein
MTAKTLPITRESPIKISVTPSFTVEQVASAANCCTKTVYRELRSRRLKGFRFGNKWLITQDQLDEYLRRPTTQDDANKVASRILSAV